MIINQCAECGKKFGDLRSHIRKHKMTWQEYNEKHGTIPRSLNAPCKIPESVKLNDQFQIEAILRYKR